MCTIISRKYTRVEQCSPLQYRTIDKNTQSATTSIVVVIQGSITLYSLNSCSFLSARSLSSAMCLGISLLWRHPPYEWTSMPSSSISCFTTSLRGISSLRQFDAIYITAERFSEKGKGGALPNKRGGDVDVKVFWYAVGIVGIIMVMDKGVTYNKVEFLTPWKYIVANLELRWKSATASNCFMKFLSKAKWV